MLRGSADRPGAASAEARIGDLHGTGPNALGRNLDDRAGQGLAEYALILALIAIVAIIALIFLGGQIGSILRDIGDSI